MSIRLTIALLILAAAPVLAADSVGVSPEMWARVRAAEAAQVYLAPTPSPQAPAKLSLRDCLALAFEHNAGYRQTVKQLVDARRALWVASQLGTYTVNAAGQREQRAGAEEAESSLSTDANLRYRVPNGGAFVADVGTGTQESFGDLFSQQPAVALSYDQPLLRGFGRASSAYEQLRSARVALASQELSFYDSHQTLAQRVIGDYVNVQLAQGEVQIAERAVDRAKQLYDINYAKFTGEGLKKPDEEWVSQVAEIDVDQARLSWEQAKETLISRQQSYRDSLDTLLLDMGLVPAGAPELTTSIPYRPQEYDEASLIPVALASSTQLGLLELSRLDAEADLRIARSEHLPDVTASVGITDLGETLGGVTRSRGWFTGVTMQVPLFDRQRSNNVGRAQRALQVLDQQRIAARDQVTQELQREVRAATSSRLRIDLGRLSVTLAQKSREAAKGMYDEGLSDYLRVLDAEDRLVQAERSLLQEQVTYFLTTVRVRRALGEDVTQGLPE